MALRVRRGSPAPYAAARSWTRSATRPWSSWMGYGSSSSTSTPPDRSRHASRKYMIERAEREGLLRPGDTIVEAISGNTGNAMSMVAAAKGYRMLVVMPEGMSPERVAISRAHGADVLLIGDFHVTAALEHARLLGERPGYFHPGSSTPSGT